MRCLAVYAAELQPIIGTICCRMHVCIGKGRCAMKIYVLLRDGVPLGYALAAATHCTLGKKAASLFNRRGPVSLGIMRMSGSCCSALAFSFPIFDGTRRCPQESVNLGKKTLFIEMFMSYIFVCTQQHCCIFHACRNIPSNCSRTAAKENKWHIAFFRIAFYVLQQIENYSPP